AEQRLETGGVVRRGDDENVADTGQHQGAERIVDHRLVIDRQQLLGDAAGDRIKPRAAAAGEDDAFHRKSLRSKYRADVPAPLSMVAAAMRLAPLLPIARATSVIRNRAQRWRIE